MHQPKVKPQNFKRAAPKGPEIEVSLIPIHGIQPERIQINHLAILAFDDIYEYVRLANGNTRRERTGCHIASRSHFGWLVSETATEVERLIENVATKTYINPGRA